MTDQTPIERFYAGRAADFRGRASELRRRVGTLSNARLVVFLLGVGLVVAANAFVPALWVAAAAAIAGFVILVGVHRRVAARLRDAEAHAHLADLGVARCRREWTRLPVVLAASATGVHPYAHDLDLFGSPAVSQLLGPVRTLHGGQTLRTWLTAPSSIEQIRDRQAAVRALGANIDFRDGLAVNALRLPPQSDRRLAAFLHWLESAPLAQTPAPLVWFARIVPALTVTLGIAQAAGLLSSGLWLLPFAVSTAFAMANLRRIYRTFNAAFTNEAGPLSYAAVFAAAQQMPRSATLLEYLHQGMHAGGSAATGIKQLERIILCSDARRSGVLAILLEVFFLWSFHVHVALERWHRAARPHVRGWFEALGVVEALASLATPAHDQPTWCFPDVVSEADRIAARDVAHPMLSDRVRVANDVVVGPPGTLVLVTGSNMSGKSTLLRAVGVNTVLALAGAPVCASAYRTPVVRLYTSISVQDSLAAGVSLYMAQLRRLKQIVDAAQAAQPGELCCYLLDEILSGTNSADRTIAVRAVIDHLLETNSIGMLTTHDLALAEDERIAAAAQNIHFEEAIDPATEGMTFDYRVRPGPVRTSNALALMRLLGFRVE